MTSAMTSKHHEQRARQRLYEVGCAEWRQSAHSANAQPHTSVNQLSFFVDSAQLSPITASQPGTRFAQSSTQFIYFQVAMLNRWRAARWTYRVTAHLYHPDGALMEEIHDRVTVEPAYEIFCYTGRWGTEASGQWSPGSYRVEVCVDNQKTITGTFAIAADHAAQLANIKRLLRLACLQAGSEKSISR